MQPSINTMQVKKTATGVVQAIHSNIAELLAFVFPPLLDGEGWGEVRALW
jgi:hypothetical protein